MKVPVPTYGNTLRHLHEYFPHMEKDIRERVDLGLSLQKDGSMWYRSEAQKPAVDGQAGTILRFYREHQMSEDDAF